MFCCSLWHGNAWFLTSYKIRCADCAAQSNLIILSWRISCTVKQQTNCKITKLHMTHCTRWMPKVMHNAKMHLCKMQHRTFGATKTMTTTNDSMLNVSFSHVQSIRHFITMRKWTCSVWMHTFVTHLWVTHSSHIALFILLRFSEHTKKTTMLFRDVNHGDFYFIAYSLRSKHIAHEKQQQQRQ